MLVADYNAESGERTVKTIREASGTAVFHPADVSNPQDVDALMHKVVEPGKMAGWIAPPERGVNNLAIDYEYVKLH